MYFRLKWYQTRTLVNQEVMHSLSMNMSVICIVSIGLNFNIIRHWRHIHLSKLSHFIMNTWNYWSKHCHFLHSCDFCLLLIAFANSLDAGQDRRFVSTDLDPNHLTLIVFLKTFLVEKINFEKYQQL